MSIIKRFKYNHNRPLEDFQKDIDIIRDAGFKPVAVTQMHFEDTFIFETDEEATKAYKQLEEGYCSKVTGWWYGKKDFEKEVKEYETSWDTKVLIYWL